MFADILSFIEAISEVYNYHITTYCHSVTNIQSICITGRLFNEQKLYSQGSLYKQREA